MSIKAHMPLTMRRATDNKQVVEVKGSTVGECLRHIVRQFPSTEKQLFAEDGRLHLHVDIWVNEKNAYPEELIKPVLDGDELYIVVSS